ncbi:MAG: aldehyde dehydrogenase family protein [Bauldia sp.]|nr:aldehyde dehydrogenase family protein [Bauldia sp.]
MTLSLRTNAFIDGAWTPAASGMTFRTYNPGTGEVLADVAACDREDVNLAVAAARRAFDGPWSAIAPTARGTLLRQIASLIRANAADLALLDTRNAGRPIRDTRNDLVRAADIFDFYGGLTDKLRGATIPVPPGYSAITIHEPYGVVGAIIPWNLPLVMACLKAAPALAAGNTVVLKPAEQTPLSALVLAELCQEAGLPDGVLNVVPGFGETAGAALAENTGVDKIAFTGSTEVGRLIMQAASGNIKGLTLELGGKAPNIVFADADLEMAARGALFTVFHHQGQVCAAGTRLIVERSIHDAFLGLLVEKIGRIKIGLPEDPSVHVGALISREQLERVESYVGKGLAEGGRLVTGGGALRDKVPAGGHYFRPTVFADIAPEMTVAREEIFGPVLSVLAFDGEDDAIRLANSTLYGLTAAVWTRDAGRAARLPRRIRAGTVWTNMINMMNVAVPAGGHGQSGFGNEYGIEGAEGYTRLKTVWTNFAEHPVGWAL